MNNKTTMPEPVAFRWRVPIVDSDGRQRGESDWKFGTEKGGHPWWTRDNLITTAQAESYAEARVREALEDIAKRLYVLSEKAEQKYSSTASQIEEGKTMAYGLARDIALLKIRALIPTGNKS